MQELNEEPTDWVKDCIFYQIFPDRFAKSRRLTKPAGLEPWDAPPTVYGFKGGDLVGVIERLDYLEELGVNGLYFTPIFSSTANHRYHTYDYHAVDPLLGGLSAFRQLLDEAHRRGMTVVLDGVFNHASRGFFQFNHTLENGRASPYRDWFHFNHDRLARDRPIEAYPRPEDASRDAPGDAFERYGYRAWWNLPALPKFNVQNPEVRAFLLGVARRWTEFGIDGWRLDVPEEIDDPSFWREFRRVVKSVDPSSYLVGEIWHEAQDWLSGDRFDAVMNYLVGKAAIGLFCGHSLNRAETERSGYQAIRPLALDEFASELTRIRALYPDAVNARQMNFLTSHDTPRLVTMASGNLPAAKAALAFLLTYQGVPTIYYGEEIGMTGGHDPGCRGAFPLNPLAYGREYFDWTKQWVRLRRSCRALQSGDYRIIQATGQVLAIRREYRDEVVVVVFNVGPDAVTADVPLEAMRDWRDAFRLGPVLVTEGRFREKLAGFEVRALRSSR